ncbi:kinase-like domain-containing protein [Chytriomyces sp. MP71]|nr:kinase-like domain-containing protein [Chytriomyces sp. MP71]
MPTTKTTKWRVGRSVGKGGSCEVRIVYPDDPGRNPGKYCAKIIDLTRLQKYERDSALRESKLLKNIPSHEYILSLVDCFRFEGQLLIVTQYCEGGDLFHYLRERYKEPIVGTAGLDESEIWKLFGQVVSAVKHLHKLKVLHRDIKSKNIFLDKDKKTIKLGDFGIAKQLGSRSALATTAVGTPNYMSPELCSGSPYSWSSDLWSLGCLLYEFASGTYPFESHALEPLLRKIRTKEPNMSLCHPHGLHRSHQLSSTIRGLLLKDPSKRMTLSQVSRSLDVANLSRMRTHSESSAVSSSSDQAHFSLRRQRPISDDRTPSLFNPPPSYTPEPQGLFPQSLESLPGSEHASIICQFSSPPSASPMAPNLSQQDHKCPKFAESVHPSRAIALSQLEPPSIPPELLLRPRKTSTATFHNLEKRMAALEAHVGECVIRSMFDTLQRGVGVERERLRVQKTLCTEIEDLWLDMVEAYDVVV